MKNNSHILDEVCALLPAEWSVQKEGVDAHAFNILDSYNGALLSSEAALLEFPGKPPKVELLPEKFEEKIDKPFSKKAFKSRSLPQSELRNIVERKIGEWRLSIRAKGIETVEQYRLENDDRKGVARVFLRTFKCEGGPPVTAVEVKPYRGYYRDVASVRKRIEGMYPLAAALPVFLQSLPDAVQGLSRPLPGVWRTKDSRAAVVDLMRFMLDRVRYYEPGVIEGSDPEVLHQYRVTLRRMRSLVTLLKKAFPATEQETLSRELKLAMEETNLLRDLDVQIVEVAEIRTSLPDALQPGLDRFLRQLEKERGLEYRSVRKTLVAERFDKRFVRVGAILDSHSESTPDTIANLLAPAIIKRYRTITRDFSSLERNLKPEQLHAMRVSCKKLRYLLEFFPELLSQDLAASFRKDLKTLQNLLGRYNDLCVLETFLLEQVTKHSKDSVCLLAIGAIFMQAHQERNQLVQRCLAAARDFCSKKYKQSIRYMLVGGAD
jgi:CHAD domain-containing protein